MIFKKHLNLLLIFLLIGCSSIKKTIDKSTITKKTNTSEITKDSTNVVEISEEIKDQITTVIPKTNTSDKVFNKKVDQEVDRVLSKLNTKKVSGSNSYVSKYDEETRQLEVDFIVAQSENKLTNTNNSKVSDSIFEQETDEYFSKKVKQIPWWFFGLIIFWFLPQIIPKMNYLIDFFKPKNKKQ